MVRKPLVAPAATISLDAIGAAGDGTTDDSVLVQEAINAASTWDGTADVVLTAGKTYRVTRPLDLARRHGVRLTGGGTLASECSGHLFSAHGDDDLHPAQSINPATAEATSVTCVSTPVDLAAGDHVLIYTGHLVAGYGPPSYPLGTPDAEMNVVASVVGNTVNLTRPLAKDYAQEYWAVGEGYATGSTNTTNTGDPAPLALRKIEPATDISIDGITITHSGTDAVLIGHLIDGLTITGASITADHIMSVSGWTGQITDSDLHVTSDGGWWLATAYGARSITVTGCTLTANTVGYAHIHEGTADLTMSNTTITNVNTAIGVHYTIGLRGRGYNIDLATVTVSGGSTTVGSRDLRVDADVSGSATGCTFPNGADNLSADFTIA